MCLLPLQHTFLHPHPHSAGQHWISWALHFYPGWEKEPVKCLQYVHLSQCIIKSNTLSQLLHCKQPGREMRSLMEGILLGLRASSHLREGDFPTARPPGAPELTSFKQQGELFATGPSVKLDPCTAPLGSRIQKMIFTRFLLFPRK